MRIPHRAEVDAFCGSPATLWQRALGLAAPVLLLGALVFVLCRFPALPEKVPVHYNTTGEIDGYGGRFSLLLMPLIGLVTDAVVALTGRFPKSWNTGVRVTRLNRVRVYRLVRDMVAELRLAMAILFGGFGVYMSLLPERFSGGAVFLLLLPSLAAMLRYFVRLKRKR